MDFNPRMLILARESRRMTQKVLAQKSQTTQASVSRAEAGVHSPLQATITAWANALRYPEHFFSQKNDAPPLPRTFWRKQAKLGKLDQREIEAHIAISCLNIQALARSVEVPEPDAPGIVLGLESKSATQAAQYMRLHWRVPPGPIEDLTHVAEANGIIVVMMPGAKGFQGVSIRDSRKDLPPTIFLSADDPADRQRWTIAHEIGHLVLHHHLETLGTKTDDEIEGEADEFASEFLMPAHEIRHHFTWKTGLSEIAQMKLHWRTSMMAIIRAGKRVGRISDRQAQRMYIMMSKQGYRTVEPNSFAREEPATVRELVRVHLDDLDFNDSELAQLLALDIEDVRMRYLNATVARAAAHRESEPTKPTLRIV